MLWFSGYHVSSDSVSNSPQNNRGFSSPSYPIGQLWVPLGRTYGISTRYVRCGVVGFFFFLFFLFGTWLNLSLTFYWGGCPKTRRRQWHPTPVLLPGKSLGWRSLVGWSPWGHKESDTTERLYFHFSLSRIGEGNGNPLQCSCPENPRDGGAWWAAVYGVSQSWTRLKRLSSSSSSSPKTVIHCWLLLMVESKTRSCWFVLCLCVLSALVMFNFATLWTVACQAPLPMGFFLQEYCSGLPFPSPGNLFDPGIKLTSPVLAGGFFFYHCCHLGSPNYFACKNTRFF